MRKIALAFFAVLLSIPLSAQNGDIQKRISQYVEKVRKEWKIPGLSLAVIQGDSTIVMDGYGVKKVGGKDSVRSNTMFHIGSMSKAFTAAAISSLVDKGLVNWNDKVKDILPDFDWYCDSTEAVIEVKDLLTHSSGLVAQVGTYIPNLGYDRDDVYRMLKYIEPYYPMGEKFAYNNITFIIAAKVMEQVSGMSWEECIERLIFKPLEMNESSPTTALFEEAGDKSATAHYFGYSSKNGGSIVISPLRGEERAHHWVDVIGPAGGICSTAEDMAKWVKLHMNNGKVIKTIYPDSTAYNLVIEDLNSHLEFFPDIHSGEYRVTPYTASTTVISDEQMDFLHSGAIRVKEDSTYTRDYGYCWYIEQNQQYKVIYHTGTTWGFTGVCGFVPELDLGIAILCNSEVSEYARLGLMRYIIDQYLPDAEYTDHSGEGLKKWYAAKKRGSRRAVPCTIERSKVVPATEKIVGHYTKEAPFGNAEVFQKDGKLYMKIGKYGWVHRLTHNKGNEYHLRSQGHTFPVFFHNYTPQATEAVSFEIDFNYNENFGPWKKED